ncbi:hypothetical protein A2715_04380 [Candidatus Woesebacteria bacterium RIFCSPHIGHO2_01_FULL_39_32]|uniref:VanZ-like domain-containing protein n=1 Tax=Candidatus Woesebacteria bacterium RIFCSPLOWO2_01_FULL_39_25 TaxID=1802521 RepID=A0A1F8BL40_9BACT|nr:MAG: hypothetical protein A2715_04380 [Candidatus Woesebacteria bacterium RIFCSPHIGHO2_01_FULL_39_32]OGM37755.1 MAG: hypothetical protein A3F01_01590 [Candidatus Woesebacteria bacterium RIFCSPHIGHO2_12_FULL_38_11]OGM64786.1 MAG: hypothetical protein A2893_03990 [Candidatus Woesebacteria bacterium RIFCSPLOWO2_01_FULL_39_25]
MKKKIDTWAPPIVWMVLIFSFSSLATNPVSVIHWKDFIVKKTGHVLIYAILTILIYRAFREGRTHRKKAAFYSIFFAVAYGISDEYHQSFTPGRDPQMRDVIFDTIGSILAIYIVWKLLPKVPPKLKSLAESLHIL